MSTADNFDRVWAAMPTADRLVLLGHSRDHLTAAEKVKLAHVARAQIAGPSAAESRSRGTAATARRPVRRRGQPRSPHLSR